MLRNALQKLAKRSNLKFKPNTFERRQAVIESVMNDYKTREYNPRTAKYRSFKGVFNSQNTSK